MKFPALLIWVSIAQAQSVTFHEHIAPIIHEFCSPCHRPGEAAPFSLLTYSDVRSHASQIVAVTQRRYMPPWPPDPGYGEFAGERRLTAEQIEVIERWVKAGAPEGGPPRDPPRFTEGWQLGKPDVVVQAPRPYRLPPDGGDVFRNLIVPLNVPETRYVRALELRPGNQRVVHHANIVVDRRQTLRRRDGEDGAPGFPGMDVPREARADTFDPESHFFFWKPGSVLQPFPDDMAWPLTPGTDLIVNLHLQPSGKPETIQPVIGLYFTSSPPRRFPMLLQLENDGALDVPPGARNFTVADHLTLPVAVDVLAIYPHAHYLGRQVAAWADLPEGGRVWLLKISDWDINWQAIYTYRQPVHLPRGAKVEMRINYDNSAENPRNPSHPAQRVRAGPRSQDEMAHLWLQVLPERSSRQDPRIAMEEALMRRRLEKYPDDVMAHCNVGMMLEMRGDYRGAVPYFKSALRADPSSATARSGLGGALLAEGHLDDAINEFRHALRLDPALVNARLNLGRALGRKGDLKGAAGEFETVLKSRADQPDAHAGLGLLYSKQHRDDEALLHLREAVRLNADYIEVRTTLALLLAKRGDASGAIEAFEAVLRMNPSDQTAKANLARLRNQANGSR